MDFLMSLFCADASCATRSKRPENESSALIEMQSENSLMEDFLFELPTELRIGEIRSPFSASSMVFIIAPPDTGSLADLISSENPRMSAKHTILLVYVFMLSA